MKIRSKLKSLFALALALVTGLTYLWFAPAGLAQAPDISVTDIKGEKISFTALRGQPVLVNFWATTCRSCVREIPGLIELYQELSPRGFKVIGIAMYYDPPNRVIELSEARKIPYSIALDFNRDAAKAFGDVRLTPNTFLIGPDGSITHHRTGELDMSKVRSLVLSMLADD